MPPSNDMPPIDRLRDIMKALRDPAGGCPWDVKQDFKSISSYTIEEAYEVVDAINRKNMDDLCDELGDLLLQVVFHAQMADEKKLFDFDDVANSICDKMIRRHPHVFGTEQERSRTPEKGFWEDIKATESNKGNENPTCILDQVPIALPALARGQKLQKKAARTGFDWPGWRGAMEKLKQELDELEQAIADGKDREIYGEMGDVLFSAVNLARHLDVDSEMAMQDANNKFTSRFKAMQALAESQGEDISKAGDAQMDAWWEAVKQSQSNP